jgi:hypothetical protein
MPRRRNERGVSSEDYPNNLTLADLGALVGDSECDLRRWELVRLLVPDADSAVVGSRMQHRQTCSTDRAV